MKGGWLRSAVREAERLDLELYRAVARAQTPALDGALAKLSRAADYSRISIGLAIAFAVAGGPNGRRAAVRGMCSVAVTATVVNLALKPLTRRGRPERLRTAAMSRRRVRMPRSRSFPSGHTAAAFAFASGAAREVHGSGPPLLALASLVGYSRVHTGVHYPLDVIIGALCGITLAELTNAWIDRTSTRGRPTDGMPM